MWATHRPAHRRDRLTHSESALEVGFGAMGGKKEHVKGFARPRCFPLASERAAVHYKHFPHTGTPAHPQPHDHTTMSHPATSYNAPTAPAMSYQCALVLRNTSV